MAWNVKETNIVAVSKQTNFAVRLRDNFIWFNFDGSVCFLLLGSGIFTFLLFLVVEFDCCHSHVAVEF